jgi:hypothetical protein
MEYTSDEYLRMPDVVPASEYLLTAEYEVNIAEDEEALSFAVNCLFKDV